MKKPVLIGIIIGVALIIILGAYLIGKSAGKPSRELSEENNIKNLEDIQPAKISGEPKEVYLKYRRDFDKTENFNEFLVVMKRYDSSEYYGQLERYSSASPEGRAISQDFLNSLFLVLKNASPKTNDFTNIEQRIEGDLAFLVVHTTSPQLNGNVIMIKENGYWKIQEDHWENPNAEEPDFDDDEEDEGADFNFGGSNMEVSGSG